MLQNQTQEAASVLFVKIRLLEARLADLDQSLRLLLGLQHNKPGFAAAFARFEVLEDAGLEGRHETGEVASTVRDDDLGCLQHFDSLFRKVLQVTGGQHEDTFLHAVCLINTADLALYLGSFIRSELQARLEGEEFLLVLRRHEELARVRRTKNEHFPSTGRLRISSIGSVVCLSGSHAQRLVLLLNESLANHRGLLLKHERWQDSFPALKLVRRLEIKQVLE